MNKETKYLLKSGLSNLLAEWTRRYAVYAPQMSERAIEFAPLEPVDQVDAMDTLDRVVLRSPSSKWPPKRFFFPQSESLLKYNLAAYGRERVMPVMPEGQPVLLYGVRPCDAHAFEILDHVFLKQQDVVDPYYGARRARTTVVAVACDAPARTCFCGSLEGDPHGTEGCDLLLRDAGEGYVVEILTDKGKVALEGAAAVVGAALEKAGAQQIAVVDKNQAQAATAARIEAQPRKFVEALADIFETNVWDRIHEKCIACGTCTFLCPTCHCFDIQDEKAGKAGRRVRNWDSCMFPLFTLHASGHNPRATQRERWRQRAMHKFNYYPTKFGPIACVGCGRCVKDCPTGIDIRKILKTLEEAASLSSSSSKG